MKDKSWLLISIFTFITALVWALISVNTAVHKSSVSPDVSSILTPLDPNIDQSVISQLQQRQTEAVTR